MSAPALSIAGQPLSRYVQRCTCCRVVRGSSAFKGRWPREAGVCRFCSEEVLARRRKIRLTVRSLPKLRAAEQRAIDQLEAIRRRIAEVEAIAIAYEQGSLFTK